MTDLGQNSQRSAPGWREVDLRPRTPIVVPDDARTSWRAIIGLLIGLALIAIILASAPDRASHHPRGTDAHGQTPVAP
jgi:hypothetical protein